MPNRIKIAACAALCALFMLGNGCGSETKIFNSIFVDSIFVTDTVEKIDTLGCHLHPNGHENGQNGHCDL